MKIIYLGWGSLLWNPEGLELKTQWKKSTLKLPVEFSRISDAGKGRLTLVIDSVYGKDNLIYYAETKINNLNTAIKALRIREKTTKENIGYINFKTGGYRAINNPWIVDVIKKHSELSEEYDAIIWTDLPSNFTNYTPLDAYNYYLQSSPSISAMIEDYIDKAIEKGIKTPFSRLYIKKKV